MNKTLLTFILCLCMGNMFSQTDVTIDFYTQHQTIDGFGGYGAAWEFFYGESAEYPDWYSNDFVDFLVNDMGQTVIRVNMVGSYNYKEGTFDPNQKLPNFINNGANAIYNNAYDNVKGDGSYLNSSVKFVKAMDDELRKNGDSLLLLLSLWSPPAWMKNNNDFMRGKLLAVNYDKFADFIVSYIKTYEENSGVKVYNLSLQNEPNLGHPYYTLGCVYENNEYRDMVNVVHNKMIEEGIDHVKLIGPETVKFMYRMKNMMDPFIGDVSASSQMDMFCTHSYGGDGITLGSGTAAEWTELYNYTRQIGDGNIWMTETGMNTSNWEGAMTDARRIYGALKYGKVSSWIWWTNGAFRGMELGVEDTSQLSYYTSKNYYRYVRPGAVHIETSFTNDNLGVISFKNNKTNELTLVMLNNGTSTETVNITNSTFPTSWNAYRSSATEKCVDLGAVSGKSFTLPANSITTVVHTSSNSAPKIDALADVGLVKNSGKQTIDLTGIAHGPGTGNPIVITATSSNTALVDNPTVIYTSADATGTLEFTTKSNQTGSAVITVKVQDDANDVFGATTVSFILTVFDMVNHAPTVDPIDDFSILPTSGIGSITLTGITDGDDGTQTVTATAVSSADTVVEAEVIEGEIYYRPKGLGIATITVTVKDNGGLDLGGENTVVITFNITVTEDIVEEINTGSSNVISVYPNPASDVLYLANLPSVASLSIYSLTGKLLKQEVVNNSTTSIDISFLNTGMYLMEIQDANRGVFTTKIVVE